MRALVVYESMYGNTHRIAEAIARGIRSAYVVKVVSVVAARYEHVGRYDLIVAGGPTHAHGMSQPDTREAAINTHGVKAGHLKVDPDAGGLSLRVWLDTLGLGSGHAAGEKPLKPVVVPEWAPSRTTSSTIDAPRDLGSAGY